MHLGSPQQDLPLNRHLGDPVLFPEIRIEEDIACKGFQLRQWGRRPLKYSTRIHTDCVDIPHLAEPPLFATLALRKADSYPKQHKTSSSLCLFAKDFTQSPTDLVSRPLDSLRSASNRQSCLCWTGAQLGQMRPQMISICNARQISVPLVHLADRSTVRKIGREPILHAFQHLVATHRLRYKRRRGREIRLGGVVPLKRPHGMNDINTLQLAALAGLNRASNRPVPAKPPMCNSRIPSTSY